MRDRVRGVASADYNRVLIKGLYDAFDRGDGAAVTACYAPDATFEDPAFGELHGEDIGAMWRMLSTRATDLSIDLRSHDADETSGSANWVATYTFGQTGNRVVNDIQARFRFENNLIADHRDSFDFRRWARQALGPMGTVVALVPPLRAKVRQRALDQLAAYKAEEASAASAT